jgi:hypothetical protein
VLIHVSGLVAAAAWLLARIRAEAGGMRLTLRLAEGILANMRDGPPYYLFVCISMFGSVMLLIAARYWGDPVQEPGPMARDDDRLPLRVYGLFSGEIVEVAPSRPSRMALLDACWGVLVVVLSVILLSVTFPVRDASVPRVLWGYAAVGALLTARRPVLEIRQLISWWAAKRR